MRKIIYISLLLAGTGHAQNLIQSESNNDREKAQYMLGTTVHKWNGGIVYWYYNPASQPSNLTTEAVVNTIKAAASRWTGVCRVTFVYKGISSASPNIYGAASTVDYQNVIGWGLPQIADHFNPLMYKKWWYFDTTLADVDLLLNTTQNWTIEDVDGMMTSALGATIGLNTSDVHESVMANDAKRSVTYNKTLRGDDAEGCAALYGAASTADSDRGFNWAEAAYPKVLTPSPASSGDYNGYRYRYYSGANSYVGTKDGSVFFMGPDGVIQNLGTLDSYKSQIRSAGF